MSLDSVTAGIILNVAVKDQEVAADLYKMFNDTSDTGPSLQQTDYVNQHTGKPCCIKGTSIIGVVDRLNNSSHGMYNGGRYPAYVRITKHDMPEAVGKVYEYGLESLLFERDTVSEVIFKSELKHYLNTNDYKEWLSLESRLVMGSTSIELYKQAEEDDSVELVCLAGLMEKLENLININ